METNKNIYLTEEKLLGGLMKRDKLIVEVLDKINPELFHIPEYAHIYKAIIDLFKEDVPIDDISVLNKLSLDGHDIKPELIDRIYSKGFAVVTKKQIIEYCNIIKSYAFKRKAKIELQKYYEEIENLQSPEDITNKAMDLAIQLSDKIRASNTTSKLYIDGLEVSRDIDFRIENPNHISGIPTGYKQIDECLYGFKKGDVITFGGEPNSGKTLLMLCILLNMAIWLKENNIDEKILFFSLEMTKNQMKNRLISIISGISPDYLEKPKLYFIENKIPENEENIKELKRKINEAILILNSLPIMIDDSSEISISEISAISKKIQLKYGLIGIFIDYSGLVINDCNEEYQNIGKTYSGSKVLAKNLDIFVAIANQFTKKIQDYKNVDYRPDSLALTGGMSAIKDSHKIIMTYRPDLHPDLIEKKPELSGRTWILNTKHRDGKMFNDLEVFYDSGKYSESSVDITNVFCKDYISETN